MANVQKRALLVAALGTDALAMARLTQQLYAMMTPPVHIEKLCLAWGEDLLAQDVAAQAQRSGDYAAVYRATARGEFHLSLNGEEIPAVRRAVAQRALAAAAPHTLVHRGDASRYTTLIARPDRLAELVHEAALRDAGAQIDAAALQSEKSEWIEAGFMAAQLATSAQSGRRLLLLTGKNYLLEDDTELFFAPLQNGCEVLSSDLRALFFLRGQIDFSRSNFTQAQLAEVAKLPAELTPVYVHGDGSLTLNTDYGTLRTRLTGEALRVSHGAISVTAWQLPHEGLHLGAWPAASGEKQAQLRLPQGSAWELLGRPQPGDAVALAATGQAQAAIAQAA
ncbi:MAG: hypothetical protein EBV03_03425 [Proteobacteria bacterium]|nr:hypothetical protein [Pseudomonadota bacterium]